MLEILSILNHCHVLRKHTKRLSYDGEPPVTAMNRERTRSENGCSLSLCVERMSWNMQKRIPRIETVPFTTLVRSYH